MRKFMGYKRIDGRVGIRNHVLILPASVCASDTSRIVANKVEGAVSFNNQLGCSQVGDDFQYTLDTMAGFAANPNVYGVVIISLGCETAQMNLVKEAILARTEKPIDSFIIQEEGGAIKTIEKATASAKRMIEEANQLEREEFPISELIIGTECGGSDSTSGLASNPVVGVFSDLLVEEGASVVLSETTEFIGAEHILARRAKNEEVKDRIYEIIYRYEDHIRKNTGQDVRDGNPSPGNQEGGLTTLEEKSLGCIHKAGSSQINNVYDYSKQLKAGEGLVIMDTPGNDLASVSGMVAGGCQLVVFTTGRGTPTGHPIAPIIKITANRDTLKKMGDHIDFDASGVIFGDATKEELGNKLLDQVIDYCNGDESKAEILGFMETAIQRGANFV